MFTHVSWRTMLNTVPGCTFMAEEQVTSSHGGQVHGSHGSIRETGQLCGKTVTWLEKLEYVGLE